MRSADDARRRILEAALHLFAERGFEATGVRAIAEAADVSPPLINHHFGSKEGLRQAVDGEVIDALRHLFSAIDSTDPTLVSADLMARLQAEAPTLAYLRRALQEGGPGGDAFVDGLVGATRAALEDLEARGLARPSADPLARALVVLALDLGSFVLEPHLARHLGEPVWSDPPSARWFTAVLDVMAGGIFQPPPLPEGDP